MIRQTLHASRSKLMLGNHNSLQCGSCLFLISTNRIVAANTADSSTRNGASTSSVGVQQQRQQQHCRTFSTDGGRNNQSLDDLFSNDVQDVPFSTNATSSSTSTVCNDARLAMTVGMSEQQLQIVNLFEKEEEEDNNDVAFSSYSQPKRSTTSKKNTSTSNDSSKDPREALSSNLLAASYLYWRTGTSTPKYPITQKTSIGSKFVKSSLARE